MATRIYDISRLSTRVLNATPNGIDWIDSGFARHFLPRSHALLFGPGGPRLFQPGALPNPVDALDAAWGRSAAGDAPAIPDWLVAALTRRPATVEPPRTDRLKPARAVRVAQALARYGLRRGADPRSAAPHGALYLNASHFPLDWARHVQWLDARRDIRPVFYIHDLLPVQRPDEFWAREPERHARRLGLLARRGAAAIVGSHAVAQDLTEHMKSLGRADLPVLTAHPPVADVFRAPCPPDPRLEGADYFVVCGTIEPRKNHLLLLEVWRRLIAARGARAPRLVIVGKRGWRCDAIVKAIHDPALAGHVIEASGLSTAAWRALLGQARALLAPSFAEGFGLPVAEALCAGTPVVASDIDAHREQGGARYLDPRDLDGWCGAIESLAAATPSAGAESAGYIGDYRPVAPADYFAGLERFLSELPPAAAKGA